MRFCCYLLIICAGVSLFCSLSIAQQPAASSVVVPRLVNFSGKATDADGKIVTGIAGATFAIYKDQSDGAALWMETQNVQADAKGNYTVQLGATKPEGLPLDLFTSGEARWLGVTINEGTEQPRILLLSVPYALKAADAETIGGLPASAFVLANKAEVSEATAAQSAFSSNPKNNAAAPLANPAVTGKGVVDFIPMWDTTSDIVDSILFQKTSQIGVNTTAPAATLDVNGKSDVRDTLTLFPKGTDPTLAINGTAFKVDQTGKVTFVSGQTFPGAGTVTSVGVSAPASDFEVTGSPVTKNGTLALNWNIAPTSADTANTIVKRDSTGSFAAGTITSGVVNAAFLGSTNTTGPAINGTSTGTTPGSDGVDGVTTSATASGVAGINKSGNSGGIGVYGTGGVGVFGTGSAFGMQTDSNVQQARTAGGWVKAMVYVNALNPPYSILKCFNSALAGAAATTPPCGINFTEDPLGPGYWDFDFGFEIDDRFFSATQAQVVVGCTAAFPISPNTAEVFTQDCNGNVTGAHFYLIVY